jgi:hypothetical protein
MDKSSLYLMIGMLAVVVIALTVQLSRQREEGITVAIKDNGISVDKN